MLIAGPMNFIPSNDPDHIEVLESKTATTDVYELNGNYFIMLIHDKPLSQLLCVCARLFHI